MGGEKLGLKLNSAQLGLKAWAELVNMHKMNRKLQFHCFFPVKVRASCNLHRSMDYLSLYMVGWCWLKVILRFHFGSNLN